MSTDKRSIHYTTSNPEKIVSSIKSAEKRAIKGAAEGARSAYWAARLTPKTRTMDFMQAAKLLREADSWEVGEDFVEPNIEDTSTPTVIKIWDSGVSLYPNPNPIQIKDICWWNISRLFSSTAKEDTGLHFWTKNTDYCVYCYVGKKLYVDEYIGSFKETDSFISKPGALSKLNDGIALQNWLKYIPKEKQTVDLKNIPLLLPDNWRDIWKITEQTRLITVCE